MEAFAEHPLLKLSANIINEVRKIHNLDQPGRIDEAIDILEKWIQKQDHILNKDFGKHTFIGLYKFSNFFVYNFVRGVQSTQVQFSTPFQKILVSSKYLLIFDSFIQLIIFIHLWVKARKFVLITWINVNSCQIN